MNNIDRELLFATDDEKGREIATMIYDKSGTWEKTILHNPLTKVNIYISSKSLRRIYFKRMKVKEDDIGKNL